MSKPSDLIPELQGRLPIRVELQALTPDDFKRILTEPDASLVQQYEALMGTEGVKLTFADDAIARIAEVAYKVNETTENIGARRLHTVLERLLESLSYDAGDQVTDTFEVTMDYVDEKLGELSEDKPEPLHSLIRGFLKCQQKSRRDDLSGFFMPVSATSVLILPLRTGA